jgi:hypothetical protein
MVLLPGLLILLRISADATPTAANVLNNNIPAKTTHSINCPLVLPFLKNQAV